MVDPTLKLVLCGHEVCSCGGVLIALIGVREPMIGTGYC